MSTKLRATTRYLLIDQLKLLGQSLLAVIAIFIVMPFFFALVTGGLQSYSLLNTLGNMNIGFLLMIFLFIANSLTYENFKLLIQNGISRKTYWAARVWTIIIIGFGGELISSIYYYGVAAPIRHFSMHAALM